MDQGSMVVAMAELSCAPCVRRGLKRLSDGLAVCTDTPPSSRCCSPTAPIAPSTPPSVPRKVECPERPRKDGAQGREHIERHTARRRRIHDLGMAAPYSSALARGAALHALSEELGEALLAAFPDIK
jgi:hypothetical protein